MLGWLFVKVANADLSGSLKLLLRPPVWKTVTTLGEMAGKDPNALSMIGETTLYKRDDKTLEAVIDGVAHLIKTDRIDRPDC